MTDDEVRKWAAEWVGWEIRQGLVVTDEQDRHARCDAELAEAVRVKWWSLSWDERATSGISSEMLAFKWLHRGPIAFCRVIKKVLDD